MLRRKCETLINHHYCITYFEVKSLAEDSHHHHHHGSEKKTKLTLNKGQKWPTDKVLRHHMEAIHTKIKALIPKIKSNKAKNKDYKTFANSIERNINSIFKNCKLEPEVDAQLHIVLAEIIEGKEELKKDLSLEEKHDSLHKIINAYKKYIKYFDYQSKE